jgi:hypothetical protein
VIDSSLSAPIDVSADGVALTSAVGPALTELAPVGDLTSVPGEDVAGVSAPGGEDSTSRGVR